MPARAEPGERGADPLQRLARRSGSPELGNEPRRVRQHLAGFHDPTGHVGSGERRDGPEATGPDLHDHLPDHRR